jgi:hypothetical protein
MTHDASFGLAEAPDLAERRIIPFDYAFRFDQFTRNQLTGTPGAVRRQKITVSVEAAFTAVSIGYGVISLVQPIRFGPNRLDFPQARLPTTLGEIRVLHLVAALNRLAPTERDLVLKHGIRLNPDLTSLSTSATLPEEVLREAFEAIAAPPERIQFTYALFDDASGREFQSEPILNTAGLGTANGERPFRYFAQPITFAPMAVIRMEITELSTVPGELHVSLHGYKVLGSTGTPTGRLRSARRRRR